MQIFFKQKLKQGGDSITQTENVTSAGDFVDQFLKNGNDSDADEAITNTQDFLDKLLKVEIPVKIDKPEKSTFAKNQAARMQMINERRAKRNRFK